MPVKLPISTLVQRIARPCCHGYHNEFASSRTRSTLHLNRVSRSIAASLTPRSPAPALRALNRDNSWQRLIYKLPQLRNLSTKPLPTPKSRIFRFLYRGFAYLGFFVLSCGTVVAALFIYDYTTYKDDASVDDIPVSEFALNPRRGGPKNLPIVEHFVDDDDTPHKRDQKHKPKLVILGTGWGSVALLKQLNPDDYNVTVVSPSNHFLFTPMLPSATVGTLELRSLVEPVRRIVNKVKGHFFKGTAKDVDFSNRLVEVAAKDANGQDQHFYLPYDKLVIGVGSYLSQKRMIWI